MALSRTHLFTLGRLLMSLKRLKKDTSLKLSISSANLGRKFSSLIAKHNFANFRVSGVLAHILIGFSLFAIPTPLTSIPKPVLDGLFLFLGLSGLAGSQLWERMLLIITEQSAYPPNHYIRRVPQKSIHLFTLCQFLMLLVLGKQKN